MRDIKGDERLDSHLYSGFNHCAFSKVKKNRRECNGEQEILKRKRRKRNDF